MQHIDRDQLYTDSVYRAKYVASFINWSEEDQKLVHASAQYLGPMVPAVVDAVYQKLFSFDITKQTFANRMDGFKGESITDAEQLSLKSEQIAFRKDMLSKYLVKLVTSDITSPGFIKYLDWVALIHTDNANKKTSINVEYVHIGALMGFVESVLIGAISDLPLDPETKKKTLLAFNKLLWLQNDFFAQYYCFDGSELPGARSNVKGVRHAAADQAAASRVAALTNQSGAIIGASAGALAIGAVAGFLLKMYK
ncbi:hypothetical protein H9P43_004620 [Blastocladiella emersonii ATCC 22665]|nr:hypothetical protein H9P43_004620 [Blastocladiella emersonii ATCC 22665]